MLENVVVVVVIIQAKKLKVLGVFCSRWQYLNLEQLDCKLESRQASPVQECMAWEDGKVPEYWILLLLNDKDIETKARKIIQQTTQELTTSIPLFYSQKVIVL